MSQVLITETNLTDVANAIREKTETTDTYSITEMADAIRSIVGGGGDFVPVGVMVPYTSEKPPQDWLLCDGSEISRTEYSDLFAVIGTKYGAGDGSTTFNLPNKKGKVSVGLDSSDSDFNTIGKTGGEKKHTLITHELPSHNHGLGWSNEGAIGSGYGTLMRNSDSSQPYYYTTSSTGGNAPHNNLQPYEVDCWIIKAKLSDIQGDPLPIGTEVDYDGEEVPDGWEVVDSPNEYSNKEIKIGTWFGKPNYRKVFEKTFSNVKQADYPLAIPIDLNFDKITNMNIRFETPDWFGTDPLLSTNNGNVYNSMGKWVFSKTAKIVNIYGSLNITGNITIYCILEYTKTTD
jgi:microcystin-dependent protein